LVLLDGEDETLGPVKVLERLQNSYIFRWYFYKCLKLLRYVVGRYGSPWTIKYRCLAEQYVVTTCSAMSHNFSGHKGLQIIGEV
jgi:hypothetical protein